MDDSCFQLVDPSSTYDALDRATIETRVDADVPDTEDGRRALERLENIKGKVTDYLNQLPDNGVFMTPKGPITVAELRDRWAKTDFHITNQSYETGDFPRGGRTDFNGGDPVFTTNITNLAGYMVIEMRALWYVLHELVHVTLVGHSNHGQLWANGTPTQGAFSANERFQMTWLD